MTRFLMILTALVLAAGPAQASEPNRTERTAIVSGIPAPAGATTTTNFGGSAADYQKRLNEIQGAGDSAAAAGSAAGASSGSGSSK